MKEFDTYSHKNIRDSLSDIEAFTIRTRMVHNFRSFPTIDPELLRNLDSEVYSLRAEAVELFYEIYDGLRSAAESRFEAVKH
ncbi:PaaX family transcriptional regulator C-terminal domain-containing protein [Nocardia salmonicida]|uniref:PaaX family transcriptional regulator C-terminal domain-containing protein n=1 Tax=Nocardia salmonicida TaxID=53431 RepID=UPI003670A14B